MEQSLSSLTFKGSIMEAVSEAKQQKKLFVVYISGDNPESHNLAASTWTDSRETTATYLTAALASKNQPASGTSDATSADAESSSRTNVISASSAAQDHSLEVGPSVNHEIVEEINHVEPASKEEKFKHHDEATTQSSVTKTIASGEVKDGASASETAEILINPRGKDLSKNEDKSVIPERNVNSHHLEAKEEASMKIAKEGIGANKVEKADFLELSANKSNEVHLNIRLPDGSSLQMKFSVMDTLRMVKDYVDENQTSSFGSYDLAIPYPRKVFGEQDLSKTLQDLDLFGRQTLVVVLHRRANWHPKGASSVHDQTNFTRDSSSTEGNDGYWGYLRRALSYLNPFSYLSGSTNAENTAQESQNSMWEYGPNPSLQNDLRGTGTSSGVYQSTDTTNRSSNSRSRQHKSSPFGSNIHTLRHDEDDSRFNDRNTFWNGNSTQFGGDNDGK